MFENGEYIKKETTHRVLVSIQMIQKLVREKIESTSTYSPSPLPSV